MGKLKNMEMPTLKCPLCGGMKEDELDFLCHDCAKLHTKTQAGKTFRM